MKLEASEARKSAALAISSGSPKRPIGTIAVIAAFHSEGASCVNGVSIGPGLMILTLILRSFSSTVQPRAKDRTAALLAL